MEIEAKAEYEKKHATLILDPRIFDLCKVKQVELGLLRKRIIFVHYDGKRWDILVYNTVTNTSNRYLME